MTLNPLEFATLVVTGFTSCAEFGSYAFVHPVIRHLPKQIIFETAVAIFFMILLELSGFRN
jgi:hypothetical protein